jgi:hypothetical protein
VICVHVCVVSMPVSQDLLHTGHGSMTVCKSVMNFVYIVVNLNNKYNFENAVDLFNVFRRGAMF